MKALVLFSGGLDSTVCLALAIKNHSANEVTALSVSYGQKHKKELEASNKIAAFYGIRLISIDLCEIFKESSCSLLENSGKEISHEEYSDQLKKSNGSPVDTYVPFRNGLFLSCAASIALSLNCNEIYYGAHMDDAAGNAYPDTSIEFNEAISNAVSIGSGRNLKIIAPFIDKNKTEVVKTGLELNAPLHLTWSCYEGHNKACGKCGTCRDRLKAFRENGIDDPIEYIKETD